MQRACAARPASRPQRAYAAPSRARVVDGRRLADALLESLAMRAARLRAVVGRAPAVAVVQVGAHPESEVYVAAKRRAAERVGAGFVHRRLSEAGGDGALLAAVAQLNADPAVDGVIVQLPVPGAASVEAALALVAPEKDVDGFCAHNTAALASTGRALHTPCTPRGAPSFLS